MDALFENILILLPQGLALPENSRLTVAVVLLVILTVVRQRRYANHLPKYKDIPDAAIHHLASKTEMEALDGQVDVVIIGSGMGALATASVLAKSGYRVAVLEQHKTTIGGSTHMYQHGGYDFDVGVHYVGGQLDRWGSGFRMLYHYLSDGQLQWNRIAETYDVAYNNATGERLEFTGSHEQNRQTLLNHFSDLDPKALDLYYKKCRQARMVAYLSWALKCLPPWITRFVWSWCGYGKLYQRICMPTTLHVMKHDCGLPDDVIGCITYSYGDYGTTPGESPFFIQAFMDNHYEGGAFFPKGGSMSIAKTMVAAIQRRGGKVFANAQVEKVLTGTTWWGSHKAMGVRVKGVDVHVRTAVISDAGFTKTFEVGPFGQPPLVQDRIASSHQLSFVHKKNRPGSSLQPGHAFVYLFVGLDGTDTELELPGQNIWHVKNWNHDQSLQHLLDNPNAKEAMLSEDGADPPLVFVSNESAKDPDYTKRHPGKATVTLIAWTKLEWFRAWQEAAQGHRGGDYETIKQTLTNQLLDILYLHFPKTKGRVVVSELGTPLTANKYLGRDNGEIYNLDHTVARFDSLDAQLALHPQTTIRNLYLCGQDAVAVSIEGATLSGVFVSARISLFAFCFVCVPVAFGLISWL